MSYSDLGPRSSLGKAAATATTLMMDVCSQLWPADDAIDPEFLAALHSQCAEMLQA